MSAAFRLAPEAIPSFNSDGSTMDLAAPDQELVCFLEIATALSKIPRFNGKNNGIALPVAQHCVMGAQAILNEGGTRMEAALFLLHDAHEWAIGDQIRPVQKLIDAVGREYYGADRLIDAIEICKAHWDEAIYAAAGLPGPEAWTKRQKTVVKAMDDRMCRQEAIALFGQRAALHFPDLPTPKLTGAIKPWPAGKAEEKFIASARTLIGDDRVVDQANAAALRRAL
ncbi:hypothetical protein [Shinella zoogloeoides]|uniref:hypothetical protein n=1 Tax=Shinella zoogloeoides TaxID=352475 RepID=UPI0028A9A304|nr:hypothetical protein [Shinella zoogloeoides]